MIVHRLDRKANEWSKLLFVAAVSSIATSWILKTPELHLKEQKLAIVEHKVLPKVVNDLSKAKTDLKQADCDREKYVRAAIQGVIADDIPTVKGPDWSDIRPCEKVAPVKVPVPSVPVPKS